MNDLKVFSPPKQKAVIDYVMNPPKNESQEKSNKNPEVNFRFENVDDSNSIDLNLSLRNEKDIRNLKEELNQLKRISERKFRMEINEFMSDFEQNMQILLSLTSLFEQKTVYDIEKQKNSIIELLNSENVNPQVKMSVVNNKIESVKNMISDAFAKIRNKIENYEFLSNQKIERAQKSFLTRNNKFLD